MFSSRRWDYCRFDGRPLDLALNSSNHSNKRRDALATFLPNHLASSTGIFGRTHADAPQTHQFWWVKKSWLVRGTSDTQILHGGAQERQLGWASFH